MLTLENNISQQSMKDTEYRADVTAKFREAKRELADDMLDRGLGAIIWDNSSAGFHQLPEIEHISTRTGKERVARIEGLYLYDNEIYLIEEDRAHVNIDDFYNPDSEVKPTVVTLTPDMAAKALGDPDSAKGFTRQGSLEEWMVITDCYYEALAEQ